ncbi:von Willebrand factor type A [Desulfosarcina cetonica]|uniref:nitric oxide reductase activation protein NorD n=1 Tax=Desulfosarcina cetonica TaxID=90730 RepID=UPI0006D1DB99|nr:hypothetical protein [Desulfosarcina cetonica]VTR69768.1 von Willebrand factor type A [Desulfosarcina cetonica]
MAAPLTSDPAAPLGRLLNHLALADPEAARRLQTGLAEAPLKIGAAAVMERSVDAIIQALAVELSYGYTLAEGVGRMLAGGAQDQLDRYLDQVVKAAAKGPTLATLLARHLPVVLTAKDAPMVDHVETAMQVMLKKGTYTLKAPLETLSALIGSGAMADAHAFLDLLTTTYTLDTTYNRTVYLTHTLTRAVDGFAGTRRLWQIRGLTRIMGVDERLADDYLQGLASGLRLLSETALNHFLDQAIHRYLRSPEAGVRFLSLESRQAREVCRELQVAVPLAAVRADLERYLNARTGRTISVRPLSALPGGSTETPPWVCCDGRAIYLPDEMDCLEDRPGNAALFNLITRLEAGSIEFGTFDLDAEKAFAMADMPLPPAGTGSTASDLERLIHHFDRPGLVLDLFTLYEQARIAHMVRKHYPGLDRRLRQADSTVLPAVPGSAPVGGTLYPLYRHLTRQVPLSVAPPLGPIFQTMAERFHALMEEGADSPQTSAQLTIEGYGGLADLARAASPPAYAPLRLPYGRRLDPDGFGPFDATYRRVAGEIKNQLNAHHIQVYRSDIERLLADRNGQLAESDLRQLIASRSTTTDTAAAVELSWLELESLMCRYGLGSSVQEVDPANSFRYREWDGCMGDYLPGRVRLLEHEIHGADGSFYQKTLQAFHGLVRRIRYAFELLRPEELTILRQWPEGDAFDYRALLDYAIDRKAGLMPSDRLFIKRVKRIRDVAVLLLVDLSRSTANTVDERGNRVLDVEKQAIVLLCEALQVVGDRFAIAGFSGTGPLGVDYYRVKDLDTPFDDTVKMRIGAMAPQRSTRMGAAIRHATARMQPVQARVRLILILGDGYPNDLEYKGAYAVEDTRRAVMEARAAAVHVKAITVNITDNGQLDRLYGSSHHTLIGNIHDLPDKLVRVYSALTRH